MAIPDYQALMRPLVELAADGEVHSTREAIDRLADRFGLTREERREPLPSGKQSRLANRVGWARTYLVKAGLLHSPRRGAFQITDRGRAALQETTNRIDVAYLDRFPEFREFRSRSVQPERPPDGNRALSPEEALEAAHQTIREALIADILERLRACSPSLFEQIVVDLIVAMGYGGSRREAGQAVGGSGDQGIDGIIKEDRLGLDIIYLQAKRWQSPVGRPEVQKFAGALQGQRARKGILITTSSFSRDAEQYVGAIDTKIILIDGRTMAEYMAEHDVGVTVEATYQIKRVDGDYFAEE